MPHKFSSPLDTKAPGPHLIFLIGPLAISDPSSIFVWDPLTLALLWNNLFFYPLTHCFEAITIGWIKTCAKWFWDNFDWDWQTETWVINRVITYSTPRTLEFKSCPVFPLWPESSIDVWLTGRQTGETCRPKDKHVRGSNTFETSHT